MKNLSFLCLFTLLLVSCDPDSSLNEVSDADGQSGSITRFAVHAGYLYALNQNEVNTYSLENPEQPRLVHTLPTDYGLETITIYENTIYLGSRTSLYILGLDNPAAPTILSQSVRETLFWDVGCDPVAVKGNYAYSTIKIIENICGFVSTQSALLVYDVTNKSAPKVIGTYFLSQPNGLGYKDNTLFVCDQGVNRIEVFDISDPAQLVQSSTPIPLFEPVDLIVNGDRMIVSCTNTFEMYDVSDPQNARKIGSIQK